MRKNQNYILFLLFITGIMSIFIMSCDRQEDIISTPTSTNDYRSFTIIEDELDGKPIVIIGSKQRNLVVAFAKNINGKEISLSPIEGQFPILMEDENGNEFDIFGKVLSGPDNDAQLEYINSTMGYYFVFAAMFPGIEIYGEEKLEIITSLDTSETWSIPSAYVFQGSGFNTILSIDDPNFIDYSVQSTDPNDQIGRAHA